MSTPIPRYSSILIGLVAAVALAVGGCTSSGQAPERELVMGATAGPQMQVVAEIYAAALRTSGARVSGEVVDGDVNSMLTALDRAEVDLFGGFTGDLLAELAPSSVATSSADVYTELNRSLPQGVSVGDQTMVTDTPKLFVSTALAGRADASDLTECDRLPEGLPLIVAGVPDESVIDSFRTAGCRFGPVESAADAESVLERVATGRALGVATALQAAQAPTASDVQALAAPETAAEAAGDKLADTTEVHPAAVGPRADDLVPVFRSSVLTRTQVKAVNRVAGELTTADLAAMAAEVAAGAEPSSVASAWLAEHGQ